MIRNYLKFRGYDVTFVQNFTDIDDKMIKRANEENITVKELGERFIDEYFKDADALGIERADVHPKATEHIEDIIELIKTLIDNGYAYEVDGDVYYATRKFKEYGKLSQQNVDELEAGARIEPGEKKRTQWILPSGRPRNPENLPGTALGEKAVPDGTSSAR